MVHIAVYRCLKTYMHALYGIANRVEVLGSSRSARQAGSYSRHYSADIRGIARCDELVEVRSIVLMIGS